MQILFLFCLGRSIILLKLCFSLLGSCTYWVRLLALVPSLLSTRQPTVGALVRLDFFHVDYAKRRTRPNWPLLFLARYCTGSSFETKEQNASHAAEACAEEKTLISNNSWNQSSPAPHLTSHRMKGHRHDQNLNARALWGTKGPLSVKMPYEAALPRLSINTKLQSPPIETYPTSTSASNPPPLTHRSLTEAQTGETHLSFASCLLSWPSCNKGSSLCKGPLRPVVSGPLLAGNTINEHANSMGLLRLYSASFDFQTP